MYLIQLVEPDDCTDLAVVGGASEYVILDEFMVTCHGNVLFSFMWSLSRKVSFQVNVMIYIWVYKPCPPKTPCSMLFDVLL